MDEQAFLKALDRFPDMDTEGRALLNRQRAELERIASERTAAHEQEDHRLIGHLARYYELEQQAHAIERELFIQNLNLYRV